MKTCTNSTKEKDEDEETKGGIFGSIGSKKK